MIGRTRHVISPTGAVLTGLPKMRIVGLRFAGLEMDKTVDLKLYLPLSGRSKHQLQYKVSVY